MWAPDEISDDFSDWDLNLLAREISWVTPVDGPEDDFYAILYREDGDLRLARIHEDVDRGYETYPVIWAGNDEGIHGWIPREEKS